MYFNFFIYLDFCIFFNVKFIFVFLHSFLMYIRVTMFDWPNEIWSNGRRPFINSSASEKTAFNSVQVAPDEIRGEQIQTQTQIQTLTQKQALSLHLLIFPFLSHTKCLLTPLEVKAYKRGIFHAIFIMLGWATSRQNEFQVLEKKEGKTLVRRLCKYYVNWMLLM